MSRNNKILISQNIYFLLLLGLGIVFFFLIGEKGPIIQKDSGSFLNPSKGLLVTYWLYPRFLQLCRSIFGEQYFLYAVYVIQSILAIIISVALTEFFRKEYDLHYLAALFVYLFSFLPYGYSLPENVVSHHILTEGLALPLFTLLMLCTFKMYLQEKKRYILIMLLLSVLLVTLRPQFLIMVAIVLVLIVWKVLQKLYGRLSSRNKKKMTISCIILAFMLGVAVCFTFYYVLCQGRWSQFSEAVTGRVLCLMEYEDRELFEGETREVFDALYKHTEQNGNLLAQIEYNFKRSENITYSINENTKDWTMVIDTYADAHPDSERHMAKMYKYNMRDAIVPKLFVRHALDYVLLIVQLLPYSLVAAIFIQPDAIYALCHVITGLLYAVAILLLFLSGEKFHCDKRYRTPMYITLFVLLMNALAVNIVFYGLQRYVIYTFGMFYVSALILIRGMHEKWVERKRTN